MNNHTPLMIPQNDNVVTNLVENLKHELKEHFSFEPNSNKKLTEVALGTIGIPNGQQQLTKLQNPETIKENISFSGMLRGAEHSRDLELFMNHPDPMVREFASQMKEYATSNCIVVWSEDDFINSSENWCAALTLEEAKQALSAMDRQHDANIGITWETLSYQAEQLIEKRTFIIKDDKDNTIGSISYRDYNWLDAKDNKYVIHWDEAAVEEANENDELDRNSDFAYLTDEDNNRIKGHWAL